MTRQQANREILRRLADAVELYPDLRFNQLLLSSGVASWVSNGELVVHTVDPHRESTDTLQDVIINLGKLLT